jgi:RNA polymerase sigma-70 factor, ECF subfamily
VNLLTDSEGSRWAVMAKGIQNRDARATEDFYLTFQKGLRFLIFRQLGADGLDDSVHSCFALILDALQKGQLREPSRLPAFATTIVKRHIISRIQERCLRRKSESELDEVEVFAASREPDPEHRAIRNRANQKLAEVLKLMSPRDRDILYRFYVLDQDAEQVCGELGITPNEFRNAKHRAKDRLVRKWHESDKPGIGRLTGRVGSGEPFCIRQALPS